MKKWLFFACAATIGLAHGQSQGSASKELSAEFLNSKQALEQDELANSASRRDWLSDRVLISFGTGSKYGAWGATGFYIGGSGEYVSRWPGGDWGNLSLFASYGYLPQKNDELASQKPLSSAKDYRIGVGYQFLSRYPIHPGINLSWGKAFYDFARQLTATQEAQATRPIIYAKGYNVDGTVTYMADNWYYFTLGIGLSYTGKPGTAAKSGLDNSQSFSTSTKTTTVVNNEEGIPQWNYPTFSFGIGIATPNLFPDEVEKRRKEREEARKKLGL